MYSITDQVDTKTMKRIKKQGFSRIPLTFSSDNKNHVVGYLLTKSLIGVEDSGKSFFELFVAGEIDIRAPIFMNEKAEFGSLIKLFRSGYSHLAIVCADEQSAVDQNSYA